MEPLGFGWRRRKNGAVEILHFGKLAATLRGPDALLFLGEAAPSSEPDLQRAMARITGNYKRGNERTASLHPRNRR